ncbi:uncharacterized protein BJ212DRAFT_1479013 [Suillus subaureus]|uniref:HMG box domain-containing protein n=1 Tax=Suillus subaureus TaxID=48587 RepID=A0A9P7EFY7_9AGAM|nr:uncharacterized protein BJ212DRAFT_1479013 [Suillus subaureus]KAG1819782.1 hypothetical protein BJ212DRAFT_1479013 [Suillus subaureus]
MVFTVHPVLRGWSPASVEDDHDVHLPDQTYPLPRQFIASTSCITHQPMAPSSDRRAQRNRSRDPSWIPRPRNAFIIFRCEYSRKHSQAAQESDEESEAPNPTAKTLSKRAAEAWKQLSASDKDKYKVLADKEREEHARLYPHYRFRPMRRQISGLKKRQYDLGLSNGSFLLDSSDEQVPTYITDADEDSQEDGGVAYQQAIEKEGSESLEASGDSAQKDAPGNCSAAQRRSSSVPLPDAFPTPTLPSHAPKDDLCRSRSAEGREWPLRPLDYVSQAAHVRFGKEFEVQPQQWHAASNDASPFISYSFDTSTGEHNSSIDDPSESHLALELGYQSPNSRGGLTYTHSSFTANASSIPGWNGDLLSPCMPGQPMSHSDALLAPYEDMERAQALEAYALGLHNFDFFTNLLPLPEYPDHAPGIPCDIEYPALFQEQATQS